MDIGIYMGAASLQHKLAFRTMKNPEVTWNLRNCPDGFEKDPQNRLFVASKGMWRGYFVLKKEVLFNYRDRAVPFSLLFDTTTWTPIAPQPCKSFRGWTYKVPQIENAEKSGKP